MQPQAPNMATVDMSPGGSNPSPQVVGSGSGSAPARDPAAEMQREMAKTAAAAAGNQAKESASKGFFEVKAYIMENPSSIKVISFCTGLLLIVFSFLGVFNLFDAAFEPKEYLNNIYNIGFGLLILVMDGKESWMESCFDVQAKVFKHCYFLATHTGRALFYFYVGSMTLLVLPHGAFWAFVYVLLGGLLCLLGIWMLFLQYCGECCGIGSRYASFDESTPAETRAAAAAEEASDRPAPTGGSATDV